MKFLHDDARTSTTADRLDAARFVYESMILGYMARTLHSISYMHARTKSTTFEFCCSLMDNDFNPDTIVTLPLIPFCNPDSSIEEQQYRGNEAMQSDHISIHFMNVASYASSVLTYLCNTHTHLYSTRKTDASGRHACFAHRRTESR
jgi:hypothetical protein